MLYTSMAIMKFIHNFVKYHYPIVLPDALPIHSISEDKSKKTPLTFKTKFPNYAFSSP